MLPSHVVIRCAAGDRRAPGGTSRWWTAKRGSAGDRRGDQERRRRSRLRREHRRHGTRAPRSRSPRRPTVCARGARRPPRRRVAVSTSRTARRLSPRSSRNRSNAPPTSVGKLVRQPSTEVSIGARSTSRSAVSWATRNEGCARAATAAATSRARSSRPWYDVGSPGLSASNRRRATYVARSSGSRLGRLVDTDLFGVDRGRGVRPRRPRCGRRIARRRGPGCRSGPGRGPAARGGWRS